MTPAFGGTGVPVDSPPRDAAADASERPVPEAGAGPQNPEGSAEARPVPPPDPVAEFVAEASRPAPAWIAPVCAAVSLATLYGVLYVLEGLKR